MEKTQEMPWKPGLNFELKNSNGAIDPNGLGYQYTIQTTTQIRAEVVEQKFYEFPITDFVPVLIGTGAWMESIKTNLVYDNAGNFESGIQDLASQAQIANVEVGVAPINAKIMTWAKGYQYSTPEVEKALASDNWDVIRAKHAALVRNWQLGLQKIAILGLLQDLADVPGLASNPFITSNTAVITTYISLMNAAQFAALVATILGAYFSNSNSTVLPDTFAIPMQDWLGLQVLVPGTVGTYPVPMLQYLEMAFKGATKNPNFEIRGNAYLDQVNNAGYWAVGGTNRYVLYRRDRETIKMDLPVDLTLNAPNTANNFQWNGVGVAQFTGAVIYRVPEVIYFDWHV